MGGAARHVRESINKNYTAAMGELEDWQRLTTALRVLSSKDITETHHNYYSILKEINDLKYPINELQNAVSFCVPLIVCLVREINLISIGGLSGAM